MACGSGPKRPPDAVWTSMPPSSRTSVSRPETLAIFTSDGSFRLRNQWQSGALTETGYVSTVTVTVFPLWEQRNRRRNLGDTRHGENSRAIWLGCTGVLGRRTVARRARVLGDFAVAC